MTPCRRAGTRAVRASWSWRRPRRWRPRATPVLEARRTPPSRGRVAGEITWLRHVHGLITTAPTPITIDGHAGQWMDVRLDPSVEDRRARAARWWSRVPHAGRRGRQHGPAAAGDRARPREAATSRRSSSTRTRRRRSRPSPLRRCRSSSRSPSSSALRARRSPGRRARLLLSCLRPVAQHLRRGERERGVVRACPVEVHHVEEDRAATDVDPARIDSPPGARAISASSPTPVTGVSENPCTDASASAYAASAAGSPEVDRTCTVMLLGGVGVCQTHSMNPPLSRWLTPSGVGAAVDRGACASVSSVHALNPGGRDGGAGRRRHGRAVGVGVAVAVGDGAVITWLGGGTTAMGWVEAAPPEQAPRSTARTTRAILERDLIGPTLSLARRRLDPRNREPPN